MPVPFPIISLATQRSLILPNFCLIVIIMSLSEYLHMTVSSNNLQLRLRFVWKKINEGKQKKLRKIFFAFLLTFLFLFPRNQIMKMDFFYFIIIFFLFLFLPSLFLAKHCHNDFASTRGTRMKDMVILILGVVLVRSCDAILWYVLLIDETWAGDVIKQQEAGTGRKWKWEEDGTAGYTGN